MLARVRPSFILHRFHAHAHLKAFLQSTVLASVSHELIDGTFFGAETRVENLLANASFEEPFATFAREHAVVSARCSVLADAAQQRGVVVRRRDSRAIGMVLVIVVLRWQCI